MIILFLLFVVFFNYIATVLLFIIGGFILGIIMVFEYTPICKFNNYTLCYDFIRPSQSIFDKIFKLEMIIGAIGTVIFIVLFLRHCINNFRNDLIESRHDIEYIIVKKL